MRQARASGEKVTSKTPPLCRLPRSAACSKAKVSAESFTAWRPAARLSAAISLLSRQLLICCSSLASSSKSVPIARRTADVGSALCTPIVTKVPIIRRRPITVRRRALAALSFGEGCSGGGLGAAQPVASALISACVTNERAERLLPASIRLLRRFSRRR